MGTEIDSLEIRIAANAQRASQSLTTLITRLDKVNASLNNAGGHGMASMASGVTLLANAMQTMSNVKTADFTRLTKNIEKLSQIKSAQLNGAASAISQLTNSISSLGSVNASGGAKQISDLASGIAKLGYKSSTQAVQNIPKLATAMRDLMKTLSGAPKVSQNLIDMTNALANLARTGASSGKAASALSSSLNTYSSSTKRAKKHTFSLAGAIGKLYATYWLLFRAMGKINDSIEIASGLTEVQNVVNQTFGDYQHLVEEMAKTSIVDFGMSELTVKKVSSRFQAMGSAMGIAQGRMADMSIELTKLTADMASFYNVEQSAVSEDLASIFTGETRPLRTYGLDLTEATLKEWALKEGLDANISSMSQAEKAMLRYQYVMANTQVAQNDFANTAGTWANQVRILRQNFEQLGGVLGGTLINALTPLIRAFNTAMNAIIAFAETISNALGKIFGWQYQSTGGGVTDTLTDGLDGVGGSADNAAGSLGGATDKAKELKKELLGFDEITKLSDITDTSGGGSGGSGSGSGAAGGSTSGAGGEWTRVDTIWEDYTSNIDSLYELGHYISSTLQKAMDDIDWKAIKKKAKNVGKEFANFLNGGIYPAIGASTGRTIAEAINTALTASHSFAITFNWKELGRTIAASINEFFRTTDLDLAADNFNEYVNGILDTMLIAVEDVEWDKIGTKVGNALARVKWELILKKIGKLIWEAIKGAITSYGYMFSATPIETTILTSIMLLKFTGLKGFIGKTIWDKISSALTGKAANNAADITSKTLISILKNKIIEAATIGFAALGVVLLEIWEDEVTGGETLFMKNVSKWLNEVPIVGGLFEGIHDIFTGQADWDKEFGNLKTAIDNWKESLFPNGVVFDVSWFKNEGSETPEMEVEIKAGLELETTEKELQKQANKKYDDIYLPSETAVETEPEEVQKQISGLTDGWKAPFNVGLSTTAKEMQAEIQRRIFGFVLPIDAKANLKEVNKSFLTKTQKTLGITGSFESTDKSKLTVDQKSIDTKSVYKSVDKTQLTDAQKEIGTKSVYKSVNKNELSDSEKTIGTTAKYKSSIDDLSDSEKTISNVAATVTKLYKATGLQLVLEAVVNFISNGLKLLFKEDGGLFKNGHWSPIEQFAGGGLPNMGELFVARESGPELVGRMGGGTAVMNNNQIVASVSAGVYQAVAAAMSQFSGRSVSEVHVHLEGDAEGVFRLVKQENDRIVIATGEPALLT